MILIILSINIFSTNFSTQFIYIIVLFISDFKLSFCDKSCQLKLNNINYFINEHAEFSIQFGILILSITDFKFIFFLGLFVHL